MEINISAQISLPKRNRVSLRPGLGHIWRVCSPCPPLHPPPSPAGLTAWLPACSSALPATRTRPGRALGQVVTTENDTLSSKAVVMDRWSQTHEWLFRAHGRRKWETPQASVGRTEALPGSRGVLAPGVCPSPAAAGAGVMLCRAPVRVSAIDFWIFIFKILFFLKQPESISFSCNELIPE